MSIQLNIVFSIHPFIICSIKSLNPEVGWCFSNISVVRIANSLHLPSYEAEQVVHSNVGKARITKSDV